MGNRGERGKNGKTRGKGHFFVAETAKWEMTLGKRGFEVEKESNDH